MLSDSIVRNAVKEFGTPLYLYNKANIEKRLDKITAIPYRPLKIYAATMANNNLEILKLCKSHGLGAFVNSIKHMKLVRQAGFHGQDVMWTSTGMNERQMRAAVKEEARLNVDSANQLTLFGKMAPGGRV